MLIYNTFVVALCVETKNRDFSDHWPSQGLLIRFLDSVQRGMCESFVHYRIVFVFQLIFPCSQSTSWFRFSAILCLRSVILKIPVCSASSRIDSFTETVSILLGMMMLILRNLLKSQLLFVFVLPYTTVFGMVLYNLSYTKPYPE